MEEKKFLKIIQNSILVLIYIALFGVTIWALSGLYGSRPDWWKGNTAIRNTLYMWTGALLAMILIGIHLGKLQRNNQIGKEKTRKLQIVFGVLGITLSAACLPYFTIPFSIGTTAKAEFASVWGDDWEDSLQKPDVDPWFDSPYSPFELLSGPNYSPDSFTKSTDLEYLNNGNDSFKCDVWLPSDLVSGSNPVLIFVHGGGWVGGDKESIIDYQLEYFAAAGYTVFSVQYGSMSELGRTRQYSMEEMLLNLGAFSDWLAEPAQISDYNLDLTHCFITGLSAGGHLSALLGVARSTVANWNASVQVLGAIDYYGITDLRHWEVISPLWLNDIGLFNSTVFSDYSIVDRYSPINYVQNNTFSNPDLIPLLLFHGDADSVVSVRQSQDMNALCDARGLECVFIEIPKGEHVFEGKYNAGPSQVTLWAMERFMQLCAL